jgi:hypothetical protein
VPLAQSSRSTRQRVEPPLVVTMAEAGRLLGGISVQTVRRLIRSGDLEKASYPGPGRVLITRRSVERLASPAGQGADDGR